MADDKIDILKRAELFRGLDDDVLEFLASHASEKRLSRDEILFMAGDPAVGFYVVAEGSVRAYRSGPDGREQVMHVERAVTTIAEVAVFDDGAYPSTVAGGSLGRLGGNLVPARRVRGRYESVLEGARGSRARRPAFHDLAEVNVGGRTDRILVGRVESRREGRLVATSAAAAPRPDHGWVSSV